MLLLYYISCEFTVVAVVVFASPLAGEGRVRGLATSII
jgi:hypothetical protein